jgi:NADH:ubiquinone oxidoreductase subunit 5 (subunit L)/multisubunit Na+/H+ antiporter MnhA subunit
MNWIVQYLWLIPAMPLLAAALSAVARQRHRKFAATLAIGAMIGALILSCVAFSNALQHQGQQILNFAWFQFGDPTLPGTMLKLGWVLDPLTAVMLVMVSFVGLLIFSYSVGYMAHDENFTRFFCFLSLFAAAMLGLVIANSLLLFFICWELVGLTSYLLIGFWFHKPAAAAAAKKAFITTRIGDLAFLLGMVWLYSQTGTLLFYDGGNGCIEQSALAKMVSQTTAIGMAASTGIALLIFCGAVGKSGQVPLHVWLPDAMEGPTPVSALIHAATMVAAGVFLVARVYPLMAATEPQPAAIVQQVPERKSGTLTPALSLSERERENSRPLVAGSERAHQPELTQLSARQTTILPLPRGEGRGEGERAQPSTTALRVITWIGVITAVFAATVAVAQTDIKRILAYSTVSQLGFMMLGLGVGGVAVGMFHLITHAFFKALLFMGAGSVIHGCHEEQDIRRMGGLRKLMPVTFATYAIGMMALSGVPIFFSGFWSKDAILHEAHGWSISRAPFYLGLFGAFLTAFYMTRQVFHVFFGNPRKTGETHESPASMTFPLVVLAVFAIVLGFIGTPAWPWFQAFLNGTTATLDFDRLLESHVLRLLLLSSVVVFLGLGLGWWFYGRRPMAKADEVDALEQLRPDIFELLRNKYYVDEIYEKTFIRLNAWWAWFCSWLDFWVWNGAVKLFAYTVLGLSWVSRSFDEYVINLGFDEGCQGVSRGGRLMSRLQNGRVQNYLRIIGLALTVLVLLLIWGCRVS